MPARFLWFNHAALRRNLKTNVGITVFPILICVLLVVLQNVINGELDKPKYQCGCECTESDLEGTCLRKECGIQHSTLEQVWSCEVPSPPRWPALIQVPWPGFRAVGTASQPFDDLPNPLCRGDGSCPVTLLVTGENQTLAERRVFPALYPLPNVTDYLMPPPFSPSQVTDYLDILSRIVVPRCMPFMFGTIPYNAGGVPLHIDSFVGLPRLYSDVLLNEPDIQCIEVQMLWRESASVINYELFKGYVQRGGETNEFVAGYDFLNTTGYDLNINVWYNSTYNDNTAYSFIAALRVPRLISNAYLKFIRGNGVDMLLEYVKEMPKVGTRFRLDLSSLLSVLFFTWIVELLFPVMLTYLVYEKEQKLKIMIKMHGLKDGPYWLISYAYFFALSIALAFFVASFFSSVKTATDGWLLVMEIVPGFSLYRGLYELGQYAFSGSAMGASGMTWGNLRDPINGMCGIFIIMTVEWAFLLMLAFYLDQVSPVGGGVRKRPLFFFRCLQKKHTPSLQKPSFVQQGSKVIVDMEKPDVAQEREVVEQLLVGRNANQAIICHNLKKIYPGRDGNPDKLAVRGLSLAVPKGQCFGMLGPNGAGKTSFISMMIGFVKPTSGTSYVHGMDINMDMDHIYTNMGVCPQHDLLWEPLTGKEHLFFYGRLKNLKGAALVKAVEDALKSVNLFHGGVGDKQVGKYSGGMKRRLSVAISLIGDPKVVFMDEPSTGLDPASRNNLWNVVKEAKRNRAIVLTTHSMEEAEVLCDRLGIFVDGDFQCLGNPKELKARYGGAYIFTMTTSPDQEQEVEQLVHDLSPSANKIYHLSGTQKFELPKQEVKIAEVFRAVEDAKKRFTVHAWGLVDTTLEDVFIKVAKGSQASSDNKTYYSHTSGKKKRRNLKTNVGITVFPILICVLLVVLQNVINGELDKPKYQCGCECTESDLEGTCLRKECGIQHSTLEQVWSCEVPSPPRWPALIQVPWPGFRAVGTASQPFDDLPNPLCRGDGSCPVTLLVTGENQTLAERRVFPALYPLPNVTDYLMPPPFSPSQVTDYLDILSRIVVPRCMPFMFGTIPYNAGGVPLHIDSFVGLPRLYSDVLLNEPDIQCIEVQMLWRESASVINYELFKGYVQRGGETNEFVAGYDFLNTTGYDLNINVWYNSTYNDNTAYSFIAALRVPRLISNAYLKFIRGNGVDMLLEYVKEMPKVGTRFRLDLSSLLSVLFFTWIVELLFPVMLTYLVYEKEQKLKIMIKMHGLKDGPYWLISYAYFFALSIALAFFVASFFSSVKTATVMEIVPGFSLYRGLYELGQYAFSGSAMGASGMTWGNLRDPINGMCGIFIIMTVEWAFLLMLAFYLDQVSPVGGGVRKRPLFFFRCLQKKHTPSLQKPSFVQQGSKVIVDMEKPDVAQEVGYLLYFAIPDLMEYICSKFIHYTNSIQREVVEQLLVGRNANQAIICHNLKKIYPGRDGNPDKLAVRGLSLAVPKGQCFGMLGPNGAGKTSFISMMIGFVKPTSGTSYVHGMDINMDMDHIYTNMGVCPQHDLLWEPLTGKEHLFFYGRLKNLKGAALVKAVEDALKSVNLFHGGVGDKQVGKYSGGMKRRLSVAISLIGDPKVVFMDEPSTGLDPASRNNLWNVVKEAKRNPHSMEEAEVLCDRLGIFVDGDFQCLGNPKELKARYGGAYIFTMTTSPDQEQEVEQLVHDLSPSANKIYHLSGTQKFELPKQEVKIAEVFRAVEDAKKRFTVHAWGLVDTTLEDVFIKVAKGSQASSDNS
uniref:ABC transporter domain-containing protein n=1 Tax=Oryza barthii TaxID=65489 RepID=A0A0D3H5X1_9ORYZ